MIDPTKLYLVWKSGVYAGLALSVTIKIKGGQDESSAEIAFFDTNRARIFNGIAKENTAGLSFQTEQGDKLELKIATRELYNKHARPTIEGTVPAFRYEQDLHEWYRRRFNK